jgi:hypothetical protein
MLGRRRGVRYLFCPPDADLSCEEGTSPIGKTGPALIVTEWQFATIGHGDARRVLNTGMMMRNPALYLDAVSRDSRGDMVLWQDF